MQEFDLTARSVNYNPNVKQVYYAPGQKPNWREKLYGLIVRYWPKFLAFVVNKLWELVKFVINFIKDMIRQALG